MNDILSALFIALAIYAAVNLMGLLWLYVNRAPCSGNIDLDEDET